MTTAQLLKTKKTLNQRSTKSSQALTDYCKDFKGAMGLVSDECRNSDTYKKLKAQFNADWQALRSFNQATSKNKELQKAIRADIMQRRMSKVAA